MCITTHNTIELYPTCLSKLYIIHSHKTNPSGAIEYWSGTPGCRRRWAGRSCLLRRQNGHEGQQRRRVSAAAFVRNMKHLSRGQGLLLMVAITFHSAQLGSAGPSQAAGHLGTSSCVLSRCRLCGLDSSKWGQYLDDIYLDRPPAVFAAQFPRWGRLNISIYLSERVESQSRRGPLLGPSPSWETQC